MKIFLQAIILKQSHEAQTWFQNPAVALFQFYKIVLLAFCFFAKLYV